ncbi:MAG: ribonuclease E/G, partial [Alphaproteobacteria bacterium]|nr:ribonuclease E/G [Alphaproteobacteria bacterium]
PSTGPPALLERGPDAVTRLAGLHPAAMVTVDDPALAALLRPVLGDRLRIGPAFDDDVEGEFAALFDPTADLPGGARLHVHTTPALTALDVDLGAATAERRAKAGAQAAANRALIPALARQIRLRNLAGAILVDLGGMAAKRRVALAPDFVAALREDPLAPRFLGFTALGLAEIQRPRIHPPLAEYAAGPLAAGLAALREAAARVAADPRQALFLHATPAIVTALRADAIGLADFARRAGRPLALVETRLPPAPAWTIETAHG